jgi:hypothetical protein
MFKTIQLCSRAGLETLPKPGQVLLGGIYYESIDQEQYKTTFNYVTHCLQFFVKLEGWFAQYQNT